MRIPAAAGLVISAFVLGACDAPGMSTGNASLSSAPASLGLFGDGYPQPGDLCYRAGETPVTANYLDDSADLVACPPDTDAQTYAYATGGTRVAVVEGWQLFSIPR